MRHLQANIILTFYTKPGLKPAAMGDWWQMTIPKCSGWLQKLTKFCIAWFCTGFLFLETKIFYLNINT